MNRVCSVFQQIVQLCPRSEFEEAVAKHNAERHARGFSCWSQFIAMQHCHLAQANSLREVSFGLAGAQGKLNHLGLDKPPPRSTLSYANAHRPWQLYETVFHQLYARCRNRFDQAKRADRVSKGKFEFKQKLISIDASLIFLLERGFDWAKYHRGKGAMKLHLALDHEGYLPRLAVLGDPNKPELKVAREWKFARGTTLLFDKAFTDYSWYDELTDDAVWFVTRQRTDAVYEVLEEREAPEKSRVRNDQIIRLGVERRTMKNPLRRIELEPKPGHKECVLLTNHLELDAETVGELYRQRWEIEQFFRLLKQNLRVRSFLGTTANAVQIQIWTALITMLLLKFLKTLSTFGWSFSNLIAMLRLQLFVYRDLDEWLETPYRPPPPPPLQSTEQLPLRFAAR